MDERPMTKKQFAEHFQVTERTVNRWMAEGKINPSAKIPVVRFSLDYVRALEGMNPETITSMKVRTLERELKKVQTENDRLRQVIRGIAQNVSPEMTVGEMR